MGQISGHQIPVCRQLCCAVLAIYMVDLENCKSTSGNVPISALRPEILSQTLHQGFDHDPVDCPLACPVRQSEFDHKHRALVHGISFASL